MICEQSNRLNSSSSLSSPGIFLKISLTLTRMGSTFEDSNLYGRRWWSIFLFLFFSFLEDLDNG